MTAKPTPTVTTNPAIAIAACRNFLVTIRYGMKISGTSLMPAATPVTKPLFLRVSGWHRSQRIAAIKMRLICPR